MLRRFLWMNAASCLGFGLLFLCASQASAQFIGDPPVIVVTALGGLLLVNAGLLALTARYWPAKQPLIAFFALGDATWVILTLVLLLAGLWIKGTVATLAAIAVACGVGALGFGQYYHGLRQVQHNG
ncbi:hypothetical protein [Yoonia sp. BS5-3]|uniref:Uncharacterized protein n=1 Tax=Yoonia phaeophyticola TaxID=3137369 RepID=A0ABZ2V1V5_9RHOB